MEVEFFDSLEASQARLHQAMEAADARVKPWQAAVNVGDCFIADSGEEDLLKQALQELGLSARAHDNISRVARTIANLDSAADITVAHLSEAVQYRRLDRNLFA